MKVCLVHAAISVIGFNSYGRGLEESWINHGLSSIAASTTQSGHQTLCLDLRRLSGWEEFEQRLMEFQPDVVGVGMTSVDYTPAMEVCERARRAVPGVKIVVGGPHPSTCPDEFENDTRIDCVVVGEGEITFPEVLKTWESGGTVPRKMIGIKPDLDQLPFAKRSAWGGVEFPPPVQGFEDPFVTIIAGRGCVYNCNFCQPAERLIFGKKVRRRSPENVIAELELLREQYAFRSFLIHDDCLMEDEAWVKDFCHLYREHGFDAVFGCQSRADLICKNRSAFEALRDAGMRLALIGFESGSDRVLRFIRKGVTVEQNIEAARICRELGVQIWANYMLGIPTETSSEMQQTVDMILQMSPEYRSPAVFTPLPGSDLYHYCIEKDISLIHSHEDFRRHPNKPKIKGIDYDLVFRMVQLSLGTDEKQVEAKLQGQLQSLLPETPGAVLVFRTAPVRFINILGSVLSTHFAHLEKHLLAQEFAVAEMDADLFSRIHVMPLRYFDANRMPENLMMDLRAFGYQTVIVPYNSTGGRGYEEVRKVARAIGACTLICTMMDGVCSVLPASE